MKATQPKPVVELRMSEREFDRIMGQALQVKPEDAKPKRPARVKETRKNRTAAK